MNDKKTVSFGMALAIIFLPILVILLGGLVLRVGFLVPLMLATITASLLSIMAGFTWKEVEACIVNGVHRIIIVTCILFLVGTLIGVWIQAGVIPLFLYWGLKLLSPSMFLVSTVLICAVFSLMTGTSFGTIGTAGLALLGDRAGNDIDGGTFAVRPSGEGCEFLGRGVVGGDPDIVRLAVPALTLVDEAAQRDQPLAPAEHGVEEEGDLLGVGVAAERVLGRRPVVEIHPRVEMQDAVVAHAGSPQQRSAHGQKRHSKKSDVVATRGRSSPASVACRIRTPRSDMRCARSASKATCS